jgi:hypothetical protein
MAPGHRDGEVFNLAVACLLLPAFLVVAAVVAV